VDYCQTLLTAKLITGLVRAYCNALITDLYTFQLTEPKVGSEKRSAPCLDNLQFQTIGEELE